MAESSAARTRLLAAVRALADLATGATATSGRIDRFAIEFDESYTTFVGELTELPTPAQMDALQRLDQHLELMADPKNADTLWTAAAVKRDPAWRVVDTIAREILASFDVGS